MYLQRKNFTGFEVCQSQTHSIATQSSINHSIAMCIIKANKIAFSLIKNVRIEIYFYFWISKFSFKMRFPREMTYQKEMTISLFRKLKLIRK